jgi:hypothetical protein
VIVVGGGSGGDGGRAGVGKWNANECWLLDSWLDRLVVCIKRKVLFY